MDEERDKQPLQVSEQFSAKSYILGISEGKGDRTTGNESEGASIPVYWHHLLGPCNCFRYHAAHSSCGQFVFCQPSVTDWRNN
ncbi:Cytochrome P450 monooxygenase andK [Fusarium oxysporum f. sp. albedinis]|nr:Cytochrome P450 monooxygenase andK [Fusarium oxysporum f. sp. albedinis]